MLDDQDTSDGFGAAEDGAGAPADLEPGGEPHQDGGKAAQALARMMYAREAWHRARGEHRHPGAPAEQSGAPAGIDPGEAERRFLAAREAWLSEGDAPAGAD